jgi:hypothetical protein
VSEKEKIPVKHLDDVMICGLAVLGIIIEENAKRHHHVFNSKPIRGKQCDRIVFKNNLASYL